MHVEARSMLNLLVEMLNRKMKISKNLQGTFFGFCSLGRA
jgi:hypothetical protein